MKPVNVLLFILLTLCSLAIASLVLPRFELNFSGEKLVALPDFTEALKQEPEPIVAVPAPQPDTSSRPDKKTLKEQILKKPGRSSADTLLLLEVEADESPAKFYFADEDRTEMDRFFEALEKVSSDNTSFRIIHYGDSQIEMDRISSYLREQLQRKYGGSGMGLLPALEITPKYTVAVQTIGEWSRKLTFGTAENRASHNRYGPMAYFCRKEKGSGQVVITARENTSYKNKNFRQCRVLVGAIDQPLDISISYRGSKKENITLQPSQSEQMAEFDVDSTGGRISLSFNGGAADILGISLDGRSGVSLDNIPMRGCSGTVFKRINRETLKRTYGMLGVQALILQFGGNALPGMKNQSAAEAYGKRFLEELKYFRSVNPDMILFVIGPADMSIRQSGNLITHPQLENVRDALKKATLEAGGIFWDMYEAMGGNGSMVEWVKRKPALGAPDYIHFTQKGAVRISEIFYQSLQQEYEMYRLRKKLSN